MMLLNDTSLHKYKMGQAHSSRVHRSRKVRGGFDPVVLMAALQRFHALLTKMDMYCLVLVAMGLRKNHKVHFGNLKHSMERSRILSATMNLPFQVHVEDTEWYATFAKTEENLEGENEDETLCRESIRKSAAGAAPLTLSYTLQNGSWERELLRIPCGSVLSSRLLDVAKHNAEVYSGLFTNSFGSWVEIAVEKA